MISWADIGMAARWWLALLALGAFAFPLASTIFHRLPDRGYTVSKLVGLLIVSYVFWLGNTLTFLQNNVGGVLAGVLALIGFSAWAFRRADTREWVQQNLRTILFSELLFFALFALWVWVRAQNPSISGTEKPMEFAFLNSATVSPTYPPLDPWLSGFSISYYYFGYVMMSVLVRLSAVPTHIGFNLAIASIVALTAPH